MDVTALRDSAAFLADCLSDINTRAAGRDLTEAEQAEFDAGLAKRDELVKLIERHNIVAEAAKVPALVESGDGAEFTAPNVIVRSDPFDLSDLSYTATPQQVRSRSLSAIETVDGLEDKHRERAEHLVRTQSTDVAKRILATGSDAYRTAFGKFVANPTMPNLTSEDRDVLARAAASTTGSAGGYAVPFILDPSVIISGDGSSNPFRQISRVESITQNVWKGVSSAGVTAAFGAEAAAITDGGLTVAQPTVTAHRATCRIDYSWEIGADWTQFESEMMRLLLDGKDQLEAEKFAVGTGSDEPYGIVAAVSGAAISTATAEVFAVADLYAMIEATGPRFRPGSSFVANSTIYNKVRQFDTYGGANLWQTLGAGNPSQLLGYNAYEASFMDGAWNTAATANNYIAVFGNFSNYLIADRIGMDVMVNPITVNGSGDPTGQSSLIAVWRVGADSINDAAFTCLNLATTA